MDIENKNQLKLIGIDLDGTLLSRRKKVTTKVINALLKLRQKSPELVIAIITGRFSRSAQRIIKTLNNSGVDVNYLCSSNGSVVYSVKNEEYQKLYELNIPSKNARVIFEYCLKNKICFQGYLANCNNEKNIVISNNTIIGTTINLFNKKHSFCSDLFVDNEYHKINLLAFSKKALSKLKQYLYDHYGNELELANIYSTFSEVTAKNVNKAHALEYICKLENIDLEHTAVVGDSLNDYPMFEIAKYKFAMKKANEKLKQISTYIASSKRSNQFSEIIDQTISLID
ncbi:Cof-type HAD-IIB family hydrolase [Mycoplasma sp. E35C]|uniref:Cof-type HAD-IIB family hydrolase n=1 Tax=Mycoplasma sp. E35C TaxID=2801918 RepID=UPI001CA3E17B|nr:Cof-type HAD-IIB family hydrolase [Mycoplasma sp. E35C]QZX48991.1 HAD family phosphatase [Mycoplasma sp. E35C]